MDAHAGTLLTALGISPLANPLNPPERKTDQRRKKDEMVNQVAVEVKQAMLGSDRRCSKWRKATVVGNDGQDGERMERTFAENKC